MLRAGTLSLLIASQSLAAATSPSLKPPEYADLAVRCAFATSRLTLDTSAPARFLLHYRGPLAAFRGPLCYQFAGYNRTCDAAPDKWLTPTTTLSFFAPGQVPVDLLTGYRLEISAPQMFAEPLRYYVTPSANAPKKATAPASWNCPQP